MESGQYCAMKETLLRTQCSWLDWLRPVALSCPYLRHESFAPKRVAPCCVHHPRPVLRPRHTLPLGPRVISVPPDCLLIIATFLIYYAFVAVHINTDALVPYQSFLSFRQQVQVWGWVCCCCPHRIYPPSHVATLLSRLYLVILFKESLSEPSVQPQIP